MNIYSASIFIINNYKTKQPSKSAINSLLYLVHKELIRNNLKGLSEEPIRSAYTPFFPKNNERLEYILKNPMAFYQDIKEPEKSIVLKVLHKKENPVEEVKKDIHFLKTKKGDKIVIDNNFSVIELFKMGSIIVSVDTPEKVEEFLKDLSKLDGVDYSVKSLWQKIDVKVKGKIFYRYGEKLTHFYLHPEDEDLLVVSY